MVFSSGLVYVHGRLVDGNPASRTARPTQWDRGPHLNLYRQNFDNKLWNTKTLEILYDVEECRACEYQRRAVGM